ncbi:MAG: PAS domain S-box protein [Candidatus Lokiarchaeota archaeon]|nr:PAS domain S-box protein [Candidatus Lokiarchaeota archaeon]MBD3199404.1 PAS domain S-box protein [Candidatus Lokiarchaeota archaeon]
MREEPDKLSHIPNEEYIEYDIEEFEIEIDINDQIFSDIYYKSIFDNIPYPSHLWRYKDEDFFLIDFNKAANQLLEGKLKKLLGIQASKFFKRRPDIISDFYTCYNTKETLNKKLKYKFKTTGFEKFLNIKYQFIHPDLILATFEDITNKIEIEHQLHESEKKYRTLFQEALNPIFIVDKNKTYIDANKAAMEFLNASKEEFIGKSVFDFAPPKLLQKQKKKHDPFYTKRTVETSYQVGEKIKTLMLNVVPLTLDNQEYLFGIAHNITARKIMEEKLRQSEKRLFSLLDQSPIAIAIFDKTGTMLNCNPATEKITGYNREELIGKNFTQLDLYPRGHLKLIKNRVKTILNGGNVPPIEICIKQKGGGNLWVLSQITTFTVGKEIYFQGILQNINDLKLIRERLTESRKKTENIINNISDIIIKVDTQGNIEYVSPQIKTILGFDREEIIGIKSIDLVHPDDTPKMEEIMERAIKSGKTTTIEFRCKKSDGSYLPVSGRGSLINEKNRLALLGVMRDISEKKKAEDLLKKRFEFEHLISTISSRFIFMTEVNEAINESLKDMAEFINATRAYLFVFDKNEMVMNNTHEWCNENIPSQISDLQEIPLDSLPWWINQLKKEKPIHITKLSEIFVNSNEKSNFIEQESVKSILAFPIFIEDELGGFIGFDDVLETSDWNESDLSLFKICSEIIGTALERKLAEETLKGSEVFLDGILSSLKSYITIVDEDYNIIWTNQNTKNVHKANLINNKCYKVLRKSNNICQNCIAEKTFSDGNLHEEEFNISGLNGNKVHFRCITNSVAKKSNGQPELVVIICDDITSLKTSQIQLEESREKYKALFEQAQHSIILTDPYTGKIIDYNEKTHKILGYTLEEFKVLSLSELEVRDSKQTFIKHLKDIINKGNGYYKTKFRTKAGNPMDVLIYSYVFKIKDKLYIQSLLEHDPELISKLKDYNTK